MIHQVVHAEFFCPRCLYGMDTSSSADSVFGWGAGEFKPPKSGDVSICLNCGALAIFRDSYSLRAPRPGEILELMKNAKQWEHIETLQNTILARGKFR